MSDEYYFGNTECPICFENIRTKNIEYLPCCDKSICEDCNYTMVMDIKTRLNCEYKCCLCRYNLYDASYIELSQKHADRGSINAKRYIIYYYLNTNRYDQALELIHELIDKNDVITIYDTATHYNHGIIFPRDIQKSNELLQKATELKYYKAAYKLGCKYDIESNYSEAFKYYNLALEYSNNNHVFTKLNLINYYNKGLGCEIDKVKAKQLINEVLKQVCSKVQNVLLHKRPDTIKDRAQMWRIINMLLGKSIFSPINLFWFQQYFDYIKMDEKYFDSVDLVYLDAIKKSKTSCKACPAELTKLLKCNACKTVYYCSIKCQRNDWKVHKQECEQILESMKCL